MDDFKDLGFEQDFSDLGFEAEGAEEAPKDAPTKTESFGRGIVAGGTFGLGDELAGRIGSLLELLPGSATRQDEALRQKFTDENKGQQLDLPVPVSYEQLRDEERALNKAAEQANPMTYLGGNIVGGAVTAPALGLTSVAGATPAAMVGNAALQGARAGAIGGAGMSEASDIAGLVEDTGTGALLGGATGGLVQGSPGMALTGAGLGAVGGAALSDDTSLEGRAANAAKYGALGLGAGAVLGGAKALGSTIVEKLPTISRAYSKGLNQGVKTYSKEFADETSKKAKTLVDDVTNTIQETKLNKLKDTENNLKNIDTQIDEIESGIRSDLKATQSLSKGINEGQKTKLELQKNDLVKSLQDNFGKAKGSIGATYDKIETEIPETTMFSVSDDLFKLQKDLELNGKLGQDAQSLVNQFAEANKVDNLSFLELRDLRNKVAPFMDSGDPAIKKSFTNLYKNLNSTRANTLMENPDTQALAKTLAETDKRYAAVLDMEDAFLGKVSYDKKSGQVFTDRLLKENIPNKEAVRTVNDLLGSKAQKLSDSEELVKKLELVDPKLRQTLEPQFDELMSKGKTVEAFKAAGQTPEDAIANNPELLRLKALQEQLKKPNDIVTQTDQLLNSNEKQVRDYLGTNLVSLESPVMDTRKSNLMDVLNTYKTLTGKDVADQASEIVQDVNLVRDAADPFRGSITPRSLGFLETAGQIPANIAGRANRAGQTVVKSVSEGDITGTINYLRKFKTPEARIYEQQLMDAATKGPEARNAVMFSLMQQPGYRAIMNNNKTEEKEK